MLLLAVLTAFGATMLFGGFVAAARCRRFTRSAVPALLVLLLVRAVLAARADWEWWLFPWQGYAFVQGFTVYALAAAFFGIAAAALPVHWNRVVVLVVGLAVLGHGVRQHSWLAWPEVHGDGRVVDADHHLRQSTHYTCGPAACAAALSYCGVTVTERSIAAACLTRASGSRLFDLYRGLVVSLADCPFVVSIEDLDADQLAAHDQIVVASNAGGGHALCVVSRGGALVVHDPLALAARVVTLDGLRHEYRAPAIVIRAVSARTRS